VPATFTRLRVSAELRFPKRYTPLAPVHGFELLASSFVASVHDNGAPQAQTRQLVVFASATDGGFSQITDFVEQPFEWARYELDFERNDGGVMTVLVSRDGVPVAPGIPRPCADFPQTGVSLEIGAWTNTSNGEAVHEIDNVLVTAE